jgi:hypothetical protein
MACFALLLPFLHACTYTLSVGFFEFIERFQVCDQYRIGRSPAQVPGEDLRRGALVQTVKAWFTMPIGGCIL